VAREEPSISMKELMYDINAGWIALVLLMAVLAAMEVGFHAGRRAHPTVTEDAKGHISATQASMLGILALLLAFTFSLSLQRFDSRNDAMVDEANAIGTAYLRAQLLPAPLRSDVRRLLREYTDLRVRAGALSIVEQDGGGSLMGKAVGIQDTLWEYARRAAEIEPNPVTSGLFIQSLNELIDSFGRRDAALNRHVPEVVLFLLLGTFLISGAIVGFGAGVAATRPSWVSFAMVALIVVLVFVIFDLDRPRRGLIVVTEKNLVDLRASMKDEAAGAGSPATAAAAGAASASGPKR
jgi:uncharacterized membrane protein YedE/YeeE